MPKGKEYLYSKNEKGGGILDAIGVGLGLKKADVATVKAPKLATKSEDFGDIYTDKYAPMAEQIASLTKGPGFQAQWGVDPKTGDRVAEGEMAKLLEARKARVEGGVKGMSASARMAKEAVQADAQKRIDDKLAQDLAVMSQQAGDDLSRAEKISLRQQAGKLASKGRQDIKSQAADKAADIAIADRASLEARLKQEQDLLGQDVSRIANLDAAALAGQRAGLGVWADPMKFQMGNISQNVMNQYQADLANEAGRRAAALGQGQALANTIGTGLSFAGSMFGGGGKKAT